MQKRKGRTDSPNKSKGITPNLSRHLLVEGGPSRIIREFLAAKELMGRSHIEEEADEAAKKSIAHLKAKGLINADAGDLDRVEIKELVDESIKEILEKVNVKEPRAYIDSGESREFATDVQKTKDYTLVVTDPEGRLKKNRPIKKAVQKALEGIRFFTGDREYAAHLLAKEEFVGIRINDGHHKGYIAVFCPEDSKDWVMYFNHYEHGGGAFPRNRIEYLEMALIGAEMDIDFKQTPTNRENAGFLRGMCFDVYDPEERLSTLMRLSRSVKDLDFVLKSRRHVNLAIRAFEDGATNMQNFLSVLGDYIKTGDMKRHKALLNENEKELLIRYRAKAEGAEKEINSHKRYIRKIIKVSNEAKKLNFEILEDLTELQKVLLRYRDMGIALKREVNSLFRSIAKKTLKMAKIMDKFSFESRYKKKANAILDHYRNTIYDCSSWVLDNDDSDRIMDMTSDKGGILDFEKVRTIEEMVRFMHAELVKVPIMSIYQDVSHRQKEMIFLEHIDLELPNFICLNIDEEKKLDHLEAYTILKDLVKGLHWELTEMKGGKAIAVLGQEYAEITLPMGKHFAEIICGMDNQNKEYTINLRYVDTDYQHAQRRKEYVEEVLLDMGFTTDKSIKRAIIATLRTEDRKTWAHGYGKLLRLLFSARNLDISWTDAEPVELFRNGFTCLYRCDSAYSAIKYSVDAEKVSKYREAINSTIHMGNDKKAFTNLFMEQFSYRPSEIIPLIKYFDLKELDLVFTFLLKLEDTAKEEGNKKWTGQIQRLCKKLERVMDEKESQAF